MPYRTFAVCTLAAMVVAPLASAQVSYRQPEELALAADLAKANLSSDWTLSLSLGSAEQIQDARVVGDALYVWTSGGSLYGLDRHRGLVRWTQQLGDAARYPIHGPTHMNRLDGGRLTVVVTFDRVLLFDSYDGQMVGRMDLDFAPTSAAAAVGSMLFLGGGDQMVHAVQWCGLCPGQSYEHWRVMAGGSVQATPIVVRPGVLFYASTGGQLVSATALDKTGLWGRKLHTPVRVDMVARSDGLYVTGDNASIYRFDPATGALLQRYRLPATVTSTPVLDDGDLFALAADGALYSVDPISAEIRWSQPGTTALLAVQEKQLALHGRDHDLVIVDRFTGRELGRLDLNRVDRFVSNRLDDAVYLLGDNGQILAARPAGIPYQRSAELSEAALWRHSAPARRMAGKQSGGTTAVAISAADQDPLRSKSTLPTQVSETP
ncbi:MAG: PQQ-binding-like beta-propeller repeat protein [Planctomycetes bacterium]|nr:PQQ-binding-like beta-propeller repeat protein [Planctomycetota bacterium]